MPIAAIYVPGQEKPNTKTYTNVTWMKPLIIESICTEKSAQEKESNVCQ